MNHSAEAFFADVAQRASREARRPIRCTGAQAFAPALQAGRFVLENGLTVLLVPDLRAPIFAYQTWFRVGSKDEDPNRTGLAHLFEHLMFKGTERYPSGTFDREMEQRGAQTNAATWVDWTHYTESLAARDDNLATVIAFESDRMTHLVLDDQTFQSELEVVKNERRMSVDDSIAGTLGEQVIDLAFTQHPYRWPTIGSMDHLETASLDCLRAFYQTYYAPNNATVVVVGAIDCAQTLGQIAQAYGDLPSRKVMRRPKLAEPEQTQARLRVIERAVLSPQWVVAYRAPSQAERQFLALEMVGEVLTCGDTARLHQRLVIDEQVATEVGGFLMPFAEPGLFEFTITLRPGIEPMSALRLLQEEVLGVAKGLTGAEVRKARSGLELALLDSLKDVEGCAEALGHFETNFANFGQAFAALDIYKSLDEGEMTDIAAQVFQEHQRSAVLVLPDGQSDASDV